MSNTNGNGNGENNLWSEYRRLVLQALEDIKEENEKCGTQRSELDKRMTVLETKITLVSSIVGSLAGLLGYVIPKLIEMFVK